MADYIGAGQCARAGSPPAGDATDAGRVAPMTMRRTLDVLVSLTGVALLMLVAAYWGWRWFGPSAVPVAAWPAAETSPVEAIAVSPPFGVERGSLSQESAAPDVAAARPGDIRLLGVIAERDGRGEALVRLADGSARLVAAGARLADTVTLVEVRPDGIVLRDAAGERRIALRTQPAVSPPARAASASRSSACAIPRDYRGPVVRLNAELLQGLIGDPQALRAVVDAREDALVVSDETGLAAMLGLRKGDRVTQANGIALRAPEDVIVAVLRPLAANQPVRILGARGAEAREIVILNAGACPG